VISKNKTLKRLSSGGLRNFVGQTPNKKKNKGEFTGAKIRSSGELKDGKGQGQMTEREVSRKETARHLET